MMKDQQNSSGLDDPLADLKPLTFVEKDDNGTQVIYQARVDDGNAVYTMTVTAPSPGKDKQEKEQLEEFLANMRATFELDELNQDGSPGAGQIMNSGPDSGGDQEPDPPNPDPPNRSDEIQIEPDLVQVRTGTGPFDVTVIVRTTAGLDLPEGKEEFARPRNRARHGIAAGQDQCIKARDQFDTATLWAVRGSAMVGTVQPPGRSITVGGARQSLRHTKEVFVHGITSCTYYCQGRFRQSSNIS
jgi:hypothetical protein